jgi:histidyl-tRNA synthetase
MARQKPSIPSGTRDFSPVEMVRRNFIFDTIKKVFQRYGYAPIETPAMELLSSLEGKYGEEGDKLLFRILNSGPVMNTIREKSAEVKLSDITEKGLRYDLTVPFARYVVQHQNEITFPFKRYQVQPVWRGDRPQKGRYREFYQCDADVIGSDSLLNEVELVYIIDDVFKVLNIPVTVKLNNRKVLAGLAEFIGHPDKMLDLAIAIDKLDKIGIEGVRKELIDKGISEPAVKKLESLFSQREKSLSSIANMLTSEVGKKGNAEAQFIMQTAPKYRTLELRLQFDVSLARGLNYYTGAIFEVQVDQNRCKSEFISSICGGGRYDDLTGIFGLPNVSGVGISFGIDRIFDVMTELNLFDKIDYTKETTKLLFAHFGEKERDYCIPLAAAARKEGINTEIYPDVVKKIAKQFDYANKKQIPFVVVVGGDEMQSGELTLKDMSKGEQVKMKIEDVIKKLSH